MKTPRFIYPDQDQYSLGIFSHVIMTGDPRMASAFVKLLHYDPDNERATITANSLYQAEFFHPTPHGFVFLGYTGDPEVTGPVLIDKVCENVNNLKNIKIKAAIHFGLKDAGYAQSAMRGLSLSSTVVESAAQGVLILGRILGLSVGKLESSPEELAKDPFPACLDAKDKWPLVRAALAALPPPMIDCDPLSLHHILEHYANRTGIPADNSQNIGGTGKGAGQEIAGRVGESPSPRTREGRKTAGLARWFLPAAALRS